jgi:hypothetical protein
MISQNNNVKKWHVLRVTSTCLEAVIVLVDDMEWTHFSLKLIKVLLIYSNTTTPLALHAFGCLTKLPYSTRKNNHVLQLISAFKWKATQFFKYLIDMPWTVGRLTSEFLQSHFPLCTRLSRALRSKPIPSSSPLRLLPHKGRSSDVWRHWREIVQSGLFMLWFMWCWFVMAREFRKTSTVYCVQWEMLPEKTLNLLSSC